MNPLRRCPNASIPSDVVSRCTWSGQGPRTSRTTNTLSEPQSEKTHPKPGADDESRTRGLGHGVAALFLLSYIRKGASKPTASAEAVSRQLVKERPPLTVVRSIDAGLRQGVGRLKPENEKGPDPFGVRASASRAWKGAQLCASLSRMQSVPRFDQADASLSGRA